MGRATTENEISLTKTVSVSDNRLRVDYHIEPPDTSYCQVQLIERFDEAVGRPAVTFEDSDDGRWEYRGENEVAFVGEPRDGEALDTTLRIESPTLTAGDCASTVTRLSGDGPTSGPSVNGNGSGVLRQEYASGPPSIQPSLDPVRSESERPAIGLVAEDTTAAVARTAIRASNRDLSVFVAVSPDDETAATVAQRLGATTVRMDVHEWSTHRYASALAGAARHRGYPGLVFHGTSRERIDFDASLERFGSRSEVIIDAVPESEQTETLVGIPAYNESGTVGDVVRKAREHVDEVLVVDDGSGDDTAACAREAGATVVEHDRNRGYGQALKTVFEEADRRDVDALVILDADDQHDPSDIPDLLEAHSEADAEIVIGNRFGRSSETEMPLYRRFGLSVITVLANLSMGRFTPSARIQDTQSGFRSYDGTAVEELAANTDVIDNRMGASVDILSFANAKGFTTAEVPTTITYDVSNASTRNPLAHGLEIVGNIFGTVKRTRPVTVFGVPGVVMFITGVGLNHWTGSSGSASLGVTLLSALLVLVGVLSSFLSVVQYSLTGARDTML